MRREPHALDDTRLQRGERDGNRNSVYSLSPSLLCASTQILNLLRSEDISPFPSPLRGEREEGDSLSLIARARVSSRYLLEIA